MMVIVKEWLVTCNQCHKKKDATWAEKQVIQWYATPANAYQQYAHALDASRQGKVSAGDMLAEQLRRIKTQVIARATAISNITPYLDKSSIEVLQDGLKDSNDWH
ncbi:MAG: hypothetical protein ACNYZG_09200 [Gammaproteobacteria bacterium]